ncbi:MAG: ABC transporter permease [Actinomycetaceae bacterium]|nr:ABC transporter permease [Actinomycetaceae bacterium]
MGRYVARRLLQTVPVFFGATFLIYALVFAMPSDPIAALGGQHGLSPQVEAQLRAYYHLDEPLLVQYAYYLKGIVTGDFGVTYSGLAVRDVMAQAFPVTINLALLAIAFETIVGVGIGFVAGMRRGGWFDSTILVVSLLVVAVPTFVFGFLLQFLLGVSWRIVPATVGSHPTWGSLLLPAVVLGAVSCAYVIRLTRQAVHDNRNADYVRTARARGLRSWEVATRHILRNSLIPVVTFIGADLATLIGGAIVTEGIFAIPGVGGTLYRAILRGEATTVVSMTTVLVLVYILANLVVDLLYALLDPRIRYV